MRALIGGVLAFLFFNAGMHGRVGSMIAAFIDPGALEELTAGSTSSSSPPADPVASANALADEYAKNNGGVRPSPTKQPGTLNQCDPGYTYNASLGVCVFSGVVRRGV